MISLIGKFTLTFGNTRVSKRFICFDVNLFGFKKMGGWGGRGGGGRIPPYLQIQCLHHGLQKNSCEFEASFARLYKSDGVGGA